MAIYPEGAGDQVVRAEILHPVVQRIFEALGMSAEDADLLTSTLVRADLCGIHSHGVMRVPYYMKLMRQNGVDPKGRPRIVREMGGAVLVDGGNSMGQIGGTFAIRAAMTRARVHGVGAAALRGSNHCGAMEHYVRLAIQEDMVGIAVTNTLTTMAPFGGKDRIVGINPLGIGIPAGAELPLVFDSSFGMTARGKIQIYHQKGLQLEAGWAFDREGRPTTDPARALDGLIAPIGGYKGVGLSVCMGVLAAMLAGAAYGTELGDLEDGPRAGQDGQFFLALNIAAFEDPARFKTRVDGVIRQLRDSRRAEGTERIWPPGALEAELEARYRRDGIPLAAESLNNILKAAEKLRVSAAELAPSAAQLRPLDEAGNTSS